MLSELDSITYAKFIEYHKANPEVWRAFEKFALMAISAGKKKLGAKAIMERIRWEAEIERKEEFKANNNFTAYYARAFEEKYPQHRDLFEKREIKGLREAA